MPTVASCKTFTGSGKARAGMDFAHLFGRDQSIRRNALNSRRAAQFPGSAIYLSLALVEWTASMNKN
jgi:hypothetical protein